MATGLEIVVGTNNVDGIATTDLDGIETSVEDKTD